MVIIVTDRNLNPKSACLKRREEDKSDGSGQDHSGKLLLFNCATQSGVGSHQSGGRHTGL